MTLPHAAFQDLEAYVVDLETERDALRALAQSRADDALTFKTMLLQAWARLHELERQLAGLRDARNRLARDNQALREHLIRQAAA